LAKKADEPDVATITAKVEEVLDFSHLVHAAYHVEKVQQQIVWLDNADALSDAQQTDAMIAVKKLFSPVASIVRMGISIREENVFREYDIADDGAPPAETRVILDMPRKSGFAYYPARDIPIADEGTLQQIVQKRLRFTQKYQIENTARLKQLLSEASDKVGLEKEALEERLKKLTPVISRDRFTTLQLLADRLLVQMDKEKAIYLANNSLRDFLVIFRDCLADLLKSSKPQKDDDHDALKYEDWYLSTLFFRRIRHAQRRYRTGVYDVLATTDEWFKRGRAGNGCLLAHLVLTTTWNLLLNNRVEATAFGRAPRVRDVVAKLQVLGYDRDTILENLHALYLHNNGRQNLIELRGRSVIPSADKISDDMRVYLTYRGKCLTAHTSASFGYLYDCLRLLEGDRLTDETLIDHPAIRSTNEVIDRLVPILCDVAQMHYLTFKSWRKGNIFAGAKWPYVYYADFGVPSIPPYRWKGSSLLQLEMILMSLASYVKHSPEAEKVLKLLSKYREAMESLGDINDIKTDPDFREYMNQPPRAER
jgi:hypothetical protein